MGQRGPRPKPAALKILAGNPGKRPARPAPVTGRVRKGVPDRPPEVTGEAAAEWDRVAPDLEAAGLLAVADRGVLAAYCLAVADMLAARDAIVAHGRFIRTPVQTSRGEKIGEKIVEHPACRMLDRASARVKSLAELLGLTPSSRARLESGAPAGAPVADPFDEIERRIRAANSGG